MARSLVLGTILGGLVAFIWSSISWEVLGWHEKTMLSFQNPNEVAAVVLTDTVRDGTYILPGEPPTVGMSPQEKKQAEATLMESMQKGPVMVAAVRRGGFGRFNRALALQVASLMAAAFLMTWLALQTRESSYARRVLFCAVIGLTASVMVDLPNWNWWGFSGAYTAVNLADSTITWLLAGLVIARVASQTTT